MTVLEAERIERPAILFAPEPDAGAPEPALAAGDAARTRDEDLGGGLTLDEAIVGAWEGLAAQVAVACPLCGGTLRPHAPSAGAGGRCEDCGTRLT